MNAEAKARKKCLRAAKQELAKREQENRASQAVREVERRKSDLYERVLALAPDREQLVQEAVPLLKTNPEAAKMMIARGAAMDAIKSQTRQSIVMVSMLDTMRRCIDLREESFALLRELQTAHVKFHTKEELKKIKEANAIHIIMQELAASGYNDELNIYNAGLGSGEGSTFEADVLAAGRQAAIDAIDD